MALPGIKTTVQWSNHDEQNCDWCRRKAEKIGVIEEEKVPINRTYWYSANMNRGLPGDYENPVNDVQETAVSDANLISSLCDDGQHAPVLDIDFDAELVESSSPGHYHLYFNKKIPWERYEEVLRVLGEAGLLETGWVKASIARQQSLLRKPGTLKKDSPFRAEVARVTELLNAANVAVDNTTAALNEAKGENARLVEENEELKARLADLRERPTADQDAAALTWTS